MELSFEQQYAFNKYIVGENIFITGPGGSGKSALIKNIYNHAKNHNKTIQVTALTGCAALLLNTNAKTLHSWAGIGLGNKSIEELTSIINKNGRVKSNWRCTNILVVDEVSMLSLKLFNLLNNLAKRIRRDSRPFGGIQLIFSGDFFQLAPVGKREDPESSQFCFESLDWNTTFSRDNEIQLKVIFRQTDSRYTKILNQIRCGKIKRSTIELIKDYVNREKEEGISIVKLYPIRAKVDEINNKEMEKLNSECKTFHISFQTNMSMSNSEANRRNSFTMQNITTELEYMANNIMCNRKLVLKLGAQVMSIVNIQDGVGRIMVCNGSQGKIIKFHEETGHPVVLFNNRQELTMSPHIWESELIPGIGVKQIPLILSWAMTIHKSQGVTLDNAEIDIGSRVFACGQSYVALSRLRSLDGLYLTSFDETKIKTNLKVGAYYEELDVYEQYYHTLLSEIDETEDIEDIELELELEPETETILPEATAIVVSLPEAIQIAVPLS